MDPEGARNCPPFSFGSQAIAWPLDLACDPVIPRGHRRRPPQAGCGMESRRQAALSPASPPVGSPGPSLAAPLVPRLGWEGRAQRSLPAAVWLPPLEARADGWLAGAKLIHNDLCLSPGQQRVTFH